MKSLSAILVIILVSVVSGFGFPFRSTAFWCPGQITLENQQVITGDINYELKFNAIQVRKDGTVRTYTAEQIAHFDLFDKVKHRDRRYVAIDYPLAEGYRRKTFFEVLTDGPMTVLRKTKYVRRPRVTEDFRAPHVYLNAVCRHTYYLFNDGELTELDDFQKQVLPLMERHEAVVRDYIQRCRLKLRKIHEQMRIVHLYNQLCKQEINHGAVSEVR